MNRKDEVTKAIADIDFASKNYQVHLNTTAGDIVLDLYPNVAPEHCKNMIGLAKIGYYDGLIFHRVIKGFMIQGGCPQGTGTGGPGYNVDAEFNDVSHEPGVLSAARSSDPNSAGSQFFICLGAHDHLDGQYTAFGKATDESMSVVNEIGMTQTDGGDRPLQEAKITKASVVEV